MDEDAARLRRTREFFGPRAATWDAKFGSDGPAYRAAVRQAGIPWGGVVVDVGCGTGRALLPLRGAVGSEGRVIGVDSTPEMLAAAAGSARQSRAALVLADALHLPLADRCAGALFTAGLLNHFTDPYAVLRELARITSRPGRLVMFHPSGRRELAARHGGTLRPGETLDSSVLGPMLGATGWHLNTYDDAEHRFFAVADRTSTG